MIAREKQEPDHKINSIPSTPTQIPVGIWRTKKVFDWKNNIAGIVLANLILVMVTRLGFVFTFICKDFTILPEFVYPPIYWIVPFEFLIVLFVNQLVDKKRVEYFDKLTDEEICEEMKKKK
jgi:hypothetical protein